MPRSKILVSALALALSSASFAQAQEVSNVISFGDSLTDAGNYAALPPPFFFGAQGSFTTNPDDVWTHILARAFGVTQTASLAGGTNYAWGGAPTSFNVAGVPFALSCIPATLPCRSVAQQLQQHLASRGGTADPNALYTYLAGANDLFNYLGAAGAGFITGAQAQQFTGASAATAVGQIGTLQNAGANYVVVVNLPDIGQAPAFRGTPGQSSVTGLVFVYNSALNAGLASLGDGIIPINAYQLVNEVIANPGEYGFTNVTSPACNLALTGGSSLFCTTATLVAPDANNTYLFADGVHPTGAGQRLLASAVLSTIVAPLQVSLAGELPMQVYDNHSSTINQQIFGMNRAQRSDGEANIYGALQFSQQDYEAGARTAAFDSELITGTFGGDVRFRDTISLGATVTLGSSRGDTVGAAIDATEVLVSGYAVAHLGSAYLSGIVSGGSSNLDIDRSIVLGLSNRVESGNTSATHKAVEIGGGFAFGSEDFKHGPFVSLTWQEISVQGYAEDSLDSTSMFFSDFERQSAVTRLGYQAQGTSGSFQPFGRIAWAREGEEDPIAVQAGSNTMNGHFPLDGFQPAKDWMEADVGVNYAMSDATSLSLSYRARLSDDTQDVKSLNVAFRTEF